MPLKVFLSHASIDKPLVSEVKYFLEDGGDIECWLDIFEINLGVNIASRTAPFRVRSAFSLSYTRVSVYENATLNGTICEPKVHERCEEATAVPTIVV